MAHRLQTATKSRSARVRYYNLPKELLWKDMEDKYQNAERMVARYRYFCEHHEFLGECYPNLNIDFGPGSLAAYLGCDIGFNERIPSGSSRVLKTGTMYRISNLTRTTNGSKNTSSWQKNAKNWPVMISM